MFGFNKKIEFLKNLATEKASGFGDNIINRLSDSINTHTDNLSETIETTARNLPDMILPDSGEEISPQIENNFDLPSLNELPLSKPDSNSLFNQTASILSQTETDSLEGFNDRFRSVAENNSREIMKKKLNHFQIERLAEILKDKLEIEFKIQKERWGEEPD